jgi:hypothetical protein
MAVNITEVRRVPDESAEKVDIENEERRLRNVELSDESKPSRDVRQVGYRLLQFINLGGICAKQISFWEPLCWRYSAKTLDSYERWYENICAAFS